MKKIIITLSVVLLSTIVFAQKNISDYVKTQDCLFFYQKVSLGFGHFLTGKLNGKKTNYSFDDVVEYRKNGEIFIKMPEIVDNKPTKNSVFMKAMTYRNGLVLYEYSKVDVNGIKYSEFYIFDDHKFVVDVNKQNYLTLIDFFETDVHAK